MAHPNPAAADAARRPVGSDPVTLDQMKGAVGSLLFLWSELERTLRAGLKTQIGPERAASVHQVSRVLALWSEPVIGAGADRPRQVALGRRLHVALTEALAVRNMVCHGLVGIQALGSGLSSDAHLVVELGEVRRVLSWDELQALFQWMSRSPHLIADLTRAAKTADAATSEAGLIGWAGFPEQGVTQRDDVYR